jgi:hypothetical protein
MARPDDAAENQGRQRSTLAGGGRVMNFETVAITTVAGLLAGWLPNSERSS